MTPVKLPARRRLCHNWTKLSFRASPTPYRVRGRLVGRDPWFDRPFGRLTVLSRVEGLTILSEVEGESRKVGRKSDYSGSPADFGGR
jgi:hypothetical protein